MNKVILSCVFSVISFANVFGMIPPEEKSALTMPETSSMKDVAAINKDIRVFSDFLEEHKDEQTLSPTDQAELRQRFINLEPAFTALLSFSNKDIYDCLKPFMLSLDSIDTHGFEKLKTACLNPEDLKKVNEIIENPGYWDFDTLGADFRGSGEDYSETNKTLLALCNLLCPLADEMIDIDKYYQGTLSGTKYDIQEFLQHAISNKDFSPFFFTELEGFFIQIEHLIYYFSCK